MSNRTTFASISLLIYKIEKGFRPNISNPTPYDLLKLSLEYL